MIRRTWHGWTGSADADEYERLLREEIFPGIRARDVTGLRGLEAWRREEGDDVEFLTVMTFDDEAAIVEFTGGDPEQSVVPDAARGVLKRFDEHSRHYEPIIESR